MSIPVFNAVGSQADQQTVLVWAALLAAVYNSQKGLPGNAIDSSPADVVNQLQLQDL